MNIWIKLLVSFLAGAGAGLGTGFAGMSAAAVISPMLITFLGMDAYEAVGIALPGNGTIPAVHNGRMLLAKHAGMAIMNLIEKDIRARDIINEKSLKNALACDMALGCSSNSVLHLLAILIYVL